MTDTPPPAVDPAASSDEPRFLIAGTEPLTGTPVTLVVVALSADIADGFVRSRGVLPKTLTPLGPTDAVPADARVLRVPPEEPAEPPMRRRLRLLSMSIGLTLFLIAAVLFVYKAKEHLGR